MSTPVFEACRCTVIGSVEGRGTGALTAHDAADSCRGSACRQRCQGVVEGVVDCKAAVQPCLGEQPAHQGRRIH